MVWLLNHPLPPRPAHTGSLRKRENLVTGEGVEVVWEELNHMTAITSLTFSGYLYFLETDIHMETAGRKARVGPTCSIMYQ